MSLNAAEEEKIGAEVKPAAEITEIAEETLGDGDSRSKTEIEVLKSELAEIKDKNLRLYAEFDNFRKRASKESFESMVTANARLIGKLTEVLDNFRRAFDPRYKGTSEEFEKGVKLIHARLCELLEEEGLEEIDPAGAEFDPNLHEALIQQPSETVPENRVLETVQMGYKLKSKILAHAKVIVSKGKEG